MKKIDKNTFEAESWEDLQSHLFTFHEAGIDRYRSQFVYRGISDKNYRLETSLQRIGRKPSAVEKHLIRNFKKYSPLNTLIDNYNNIWNWIALGQHHGLPTRLLDWTYSPYVALHFMTDDTRTFDKDGIIWVVDFIETKQYLPKKMQNKINEYKTLSFTSNELEDVVGKTIEEVEKFEADNGNALVFFEPPSINDRIVNQFALFSFMLNPDVDVLKWLEAKPNLYSKIIIPKSIKWEIRDKLDQANISERIIYPGLDGISKWLNRYYSEKDQSKRWKL